MNVRILAAIALLWSVSGYAGDIEKSPENAAIPPSLMGFGATCDGKADDSPAFAAALKWMSNYPGQPVALPLFRTCTITKTITVSSDFAGFMCPAGGRSVAGVSGSPSNGCALSWGGPQGGTMMSIASPTGTPNAHALAGIILKGVSFLGNAKASIGLELRSVRQADIENNYFENFTSAALNIRIVSINKAEDFNDNCDNDHLSIRNISIDQRGTKGAALNATSFRSKDFFNGGCTLCMSRLRDIKILIKDGNGIVLAGADNNIFENTQIYRVKEGKGIGLDLSIHSNNGLDAPTHSNLFLLYSSNAPIVARGKTTFPDCKEFNPVGMGNSSCTFGNSIIGLDTSNGTPEPTVEPGASLHWATDTGVQHDLTANHLAVGENDAAASSVAEKMGNESVHIYNGSANHLLIDDGNTVWGVNEDADHNFRIGVPGVRTALLLNKGTGGVVAPSLEASSPVCTDANKTLSSCKNASSASVTEAIGGRELSAGACESRTIGIETAEPGMGVLVAPLEYPGDRIAWNGYVAGRGKVVVRVCALTADTPKATPYTVRLLK